MAEKESLSQCIPSPYLPNPNEKRKIVGEDLAEATVRRWFVPSSYENAGTKSEIERVKEMVKTNDLEGFKESVKALWEYDLSDEVKRSGMKGLFVVGGSDGALPKSMKGMAEVFGSESGGKGRAELVVIEGAGHLPMVEKSDDFTKVVESFLNTSL